MGLELSAILQIAGLTTSVAAYGQQQQAARKRTEAAKIQNRRSQVSAIREAQIAQARLGARAKALGVSTGTMANPLAGQLSHSLGTTGMISGLGVEAGQLQSSAAGLSAFGDVLSGLSTVVD